MRRFYLAPVVGKGFTVETRRRVKYFMEDYPPGHAALVGMDSLYYGHIPVALVDCPNMDDATHAELVAHNDVVAFPQNLNSQVGGSLSQVQAILEAAVVPGHWITPTTTYLTIITRMAKLFLFATRFHAWFAHRVVEFVWGNDITLSQLPAFLLEDLSDAAATFNIDVSDITGNTSVRDAMAIVSQRMP